MRCKVDGEAQSGEQEVVVSRPEDHGGRLAMKIMEPMLSLIKRHTLRTCTLDRAANAALPVLTMVLVKKATGTAAASPSQSAVSRPAAAPKQAPASVPAPGSAPAPTAGIAAAQHEREASSQHQPHEDLMHIDDPGDGGDQQEAWQVSQVGGGGLLEELDGQGVAGSLGFPASAQHLATLFGDACVELPMLLLLRCHIDGVLQPYEQRASLRSQGHAYALWLKDPMLSLMRGRRTLSWCLAPAQGGAGSLPEMTVELGDYFTRRRLPPASQSLPTQPKPRVTGSGNHNASDSSDGSDSVDDEQAHGRCGRKRSAIAAASNAAASAAETPPAKKGRSQANGQQLPSGAAKDAQTHKAPSEQPSAKAKLTFRDVSADRNNWAAKLWDSSTHRNVHLGTFGSKEDAARTYDRASIVFKGAEAKTNFPVTDYNSKMSQLTKMTRHDVVTYVRRVTRGLSPTVKYRALSVRGVDTQKVTNFDKGAYLGADGVLLSVEAALPGLERAEHKHLRDKLAAVVRLHKKRGKTPHQPHILMTQLPPPQPQQQQQQQQAPLLTGATSPLHHEALPQEAQQVQQQQQLAAQQAATAGPPPRNYGARSAALTFLRELKVALDEGALPLHV
ncbi:hypothetical protein FOA52_006250 [Chlamydomonas sp. UWO 241]|nr:hypothetical protein FOA52_006250 [Chlamydomonas sp. UWO 241]